ncbi:hypothetical protein BKP45_02910 [Anaerobacillus alkalidiazotrophicus]|uniref:Uncharacterized protein n=1 Tax=Anaerobacillus alkalidiazotrophicus TaxID=472963 RepID=A0A1S2MAV6_9BACI|nr:hypothetical protein [Anaerobacillus alkalidiazotrophicus]OIJ21686.1 hypothetical protein BKP45_02910 [Anaerobacillus alkalidiazotrophicus]
MKHLKLFVVALLLISLFMNARLLTKFSDLENRLDSISYQQIDITRSVDNQTGHLYNLMDEFIREQSWISSIEMEVGTKSIENNKATLSFNWQIKELINDAKVEFHYKYGNEQDYHSILVEEIGRGLFEASIPAELQLEPEWYTSITMGNRYSAVEEVVETIEEYDMRKNNPNHLLYYVSVSYDDVVKSGDIHTSDLGYLGSQYYGTIDTFVDINQGGYHISISAPPSYSNRTNDLQEAYIQKFKDGIFIREEKLTPSEWMDEANKQEHGIHLYQNVTDEKFEYTSLRIKVVYSDGKTFEKEVYSQ